MPAKKAAAPAAHHTVPPFLLAAFVWAVVLAFATIVVSSIRAN